jgi:two-component system sensor histidine kinase PilS (NtrC family)
LVVVSTLFLGALIIQATTRMILPLSGLYALFLLSYVLSLIYLVLYLKRMSTRVQAVTQLVGDIAVVTGLVYVTGGLTSPFSFLYLTVIVVAAVLLRGGGFYFAGLSAVTYGVLVDLMVFDLVPSPPNLVGVRVVFPASRVLYQLLIHVVGFILVALLVSYLTESLRTAHSQLEEEKERASQFAALSAHVVRSVGAGIVAADLDGRVLNLNPTGARILRIAEPDRVTGMPLEEVMPLADHNWGLLWSRARQRAIQRHEGSLVGSGTRLGLSIGPLEDDRGEAVGFVVTFQDLSEVEAELERRRMQERMAAVGELASRMAHEIKNPLASISGSAQMLASLEGIDDTGQRLLRIVVDESRRLSVTLDGFLSYARPRQSTLQRCEIASLLTDCLDLLRRSGETRDDQHLEVRAPDKMPVFGDQNLLRQVFWNLSRNALQAMPEGGSLLVTAEARGHSAILKWCDNGVGMSDDIRQRAFEPFVTTHPQGTGLGLAIVYAAVEELGGSIDIESAPGQGTTVTVELPLHQETT